MPHRGFELRGRGKGRYRAMCLVGLLALTLLVAGCGVTTANGGELASGTPSATISATVTPSPVPPSAPTPTRTTAGGSSAVACPDSSASPGNPTLILTPTTPNRAGSAHVGDIVQVRLPTSSKWSYSPAQSSGALSPTQPNGVLIHSLDSCVWTFNAAADGAQTLSFTGQPICKPGQPCADYRIAMTLSVTVS
ncbi:MAG TPA: hypothetical protein VFS83_07425 [Ktedonobacterales bacterium]|nr:hypothetical protein [Ktedonobacterales bacterium]